MTTNEDRAKRLHELLAFSPDDERTNLIDLLADSMHWCNVRTIDFEDVFRIAQMHFEAEINEVD